MRAGLWAVLSAVVAVGVLRGTSPTDVSGQTFQGGTIAGVVRLTGPLPGNPVIRMGRDPMCAASNAGKRIVQETVAATADGGLANVFVELQGTFAAMPVPDAPVIIEQQGCLYRPRVSAVRVGQVLQLHNGDHLTHNVHSVSASTPFNLSQPADASPFQVTPLREERMLQLKCDVHSWMTAFVAVVSHPYFSVSEVGGRFSIANVPPGTYTVQAWHERFGVTTGRVTVASGGTAAIDFTYQAVEAPPPLGSLRPGVR